MTILLWGYRVRYDSRRNLGETNVRRLWLGVIPVLLLAVLLGAHRLDISPMWGDEFDSIRDAGGYGASLESPAAIWARVGRWNPWHTPGYFVLLNGWAQWVGWETTALRWLSVLVGALGVAWTYRLGADMLSPRAGLFAAAILGTSAVFNDQMQDVRMHIFNGLLTPLVFWLYLRLMNPTRQPRPLEWLGFFLGVLAMLYLHYFIALPLFTLGAYHLWRLLSGLRTPPPNPLRGLRYAQTTVAARPPFAEVREGELENVPYKRPSPEFGGRDGDRGKLPRGMKRWWAVTVCVLLAGALFLPWLGVLLDGIGRVTGSERMQALALDAPGVAAGIVWLFSNGAPLLFVALAVLAATARDRGAGRVWFFALVTLAAMLLANAALGAILPHRFRYTTSLWPLLALLLALGITRLPRPALQYLALGAWLFVALWNGASLSFAAEQDDNVAEAYFRVGLVDRALRGRALESDSLVYFAPDGFNLDNTRTLIGWHERYRDPLPLAYRVTGAYSDAETQAREWDFVMKAVGGQRARLWLATLPDFPASALDDFEARLASEHYAICEQTVDSFALDLALYAKSPVCCRPDAAPTHRYGEGIEITGIDAGAVANGILPVTLAWAIAPDTPPDTYSVTLQLWDAERGSVAQIDAGLESWRNLCQRAALSIEDVPAGEYGLWAAVYDWRTGERLPGHDLTDGGMSDFLHLADVTLR